MPHLVVERLRSLPPCPCIPGELPSRRKDVTFALVLEGCEILAGIIFIVGSVCFLPTYAHDLEMFLLGCALFVAGSAIYVVICHISLAESVRFEGWQSLEAVENLLYTIGSWIFLFGTFLYYPEEAHYQKIEWIKGLSLSSYFNLFSTEFEGTVLFIIGSLLFVVAAFINGLNQRVSFDSVRSRLLTATTSLYMAGGLLFAMGSVAFLPDLGCGETMQAIGAWMFIIGSAFFMFAAVLQGFRTASLLNEEKDPLVKA